MNDLAIMKAEYLLKLADRLEELGSKELADKYREMVEVVCKGDKTGHMPSIDFWNDFCRAAEGVIALHEAKLDIDKIRQTINNVKDFDKKGNFLA